MSMPSSSFLSEERWLAAHFERCQAQLFRREIITQLISLKELLCSTHAAGKKVIVAGNGGSAAIASHCAVDLTKQAGIRCINFNEADLITCFANDYGYDQWVAKALACYADCGDAVILISSSGMSPNIVNAARYARSRALSIVTLTGFASDNALRALGQLNFWVESRVYNIVETAHQLWLLSVCDLIAEAKEPPLLASTESGASRREAVVP